MSDVPWAPGRNALVLTSRGWRGCVGMAAGRHRGWLWTCPSRDFMGEPSTTEVFETTRDGEQLPTALLPDQCPRCYFVDGHEDGCMVAANMEKGVPAFFAPWVMWRYPSGNLENGLRLFLLDPENPLNGGNYVCDAKGWSGGKESRTGIVVLGPAGFTLSPWKNP